jgi:hypothetical protein
MNDIKDKIDELKQMQKFPNYYLSQYFDELKAQVDTKFALKEDERDKYLEIITNIESFEQNVYKKWSSKSINTYDNEIKSIEDQLIAKQSILYFTSSISLVIALTKITKLIDEVKYKIEKVLFSNNSILFIEMDTDYPFLLIVNDEYIRKKYIDLYDKSWIVFTREKLNTLILRDTVKKITKKNSTNVLNVDILNQTEIDMHMKNIMDIDKNTFNGLTNLKKINFFSNNIKEIHPNLFNGLANLEGINFGYNKIEIIHENTFNGLTNLKGISFSINKIKKIHPNLFNGLANLKVINFG